MKEKASPFELLRNKNIIAILDGDTDFGDFSDELIEPIKISMPYLSGPKICDISTEFGFPMSYSRNGGTLSRWMYMDELMEYSIKNNRISDLLSYLFSKQQFVDKLKGNSPNTIEKSHKKIVATVIEQINGILYFGGNELAIAGNCYFIHKLGETVAISAPKIKSIDRTYISDLSTRALKNVDDGLYDSAITQSRTLLEEVFCYVIEKKKIAPSDKGDINKLYSQVKDLYNMHADNKMDERFKKLLSGFEKIISAISEMRNKASDAHGVGANRVNIADHHARLLVNAATAMADFILSVAQKQS